MKSLQEMGLNQNPIYCLDCLESRGLRHLPDNITDNILDNIPDYFLEASPVLPLNFHRPRNVLRNVGNLFRHASFRFCAWNTRMLHIVETKSDMEESCSVGTTALGCGFVFSPPPLQIGIYI